MVRDSDLKWAKKRERGERKRANRTKRIEVILLHHHQNSDAIVRISNSSSILYYYSNGISAMTCRVLDHGFGNSSRNIQPAAARKLKVAPHHCMCCVSARDYLNQFVIACVSSDWVRSFTSPNERVRTRALVCVRYARTFLSTFSRTKIFGYAVCVWHSELNKSFSISAHCNAALIFFLPPKRRNGSTCTWGTYSNAAETAEEMMKSITCGVIFISTPLCLPLIVDRWLHVSFPNIFFLDVKYHIGQSKTCWISSRYISLSLSNRFSVLYLSIVCLLALIVNAYSHFYDHSKQSTIIPEYLPLPYTIFRSNVPLARYTRSQRTFGQDLERSMRKMYRPRKTSKSFCSL